MKQHFDDYMTRQDLFSDLANVSSSISNYRQNNINQGVHRVDMENQIQTDKFETKELIFETIPFASGEDRKAIAIQRKPETNEPFSHHCAIRAEELNRIHGIYFGNSYDGKVNMCIHLADGRELWLEVELEAITK